MSLPNDTIASDGFRSKLSSGEDIGLGLYFISISMTSILLNAFVFIRAYRQRRPTLFDRLACTLAVGDTTQAVVLVMSTVSSFRHRWLFGDIGCKVYGYLVFSMANLCVFTITAIGIVRYVCVCHPQYGSDKIKRTLGMTAILLLPFGLPTASFLFPESYGPEPFGTGCCLEWTRLNKAFLACVFVGLLILPGAALMFSYTSVVYHVRRSRLKMRRQSEKSHHQEQAPKKTRVNIQVIKIGVAICAAFFITWTPYAVLTFAVTFGDLSNIPMGLTVFPVLFAKLSTLCNPILYFWMNPLFRECSLQEVTHFNDKARRLSTAIMVCCRGRQSTDQAELSNKTEEGVELVEANVLVQPREQAEVNVAKETIAGI